MENLIDRSSAPCRGESLQLRTGCNHSRNPLRPVPLHRTLQEERLPRPYRPGLHRGIRLALGHLPRRELLERPARSGRRERRWHLEVTSKEHLWCPHRLRQGRSPTNWRRLCCTVPSVPYSLASCRLRTRQGPRVCWSGWPCSLGPTDQLEPLSSSSSSSPWFQPGSGGTDR